MFLCILSCVVLAEVALQNIKVGKKVEELPNLSVRTGSILGVLNPTDDPVILTCFAQIDGLAESLALCSYCQVTISPGPFLAGFGKGKFKEWSSDDSQPHDVKFEVELGSQVILLDNAPTTITAAIQNKRKTNPNASLCYHNVASEPGLQETDFKFTLAARAWIWVR